MTTRPCPIAWWRWQHWRRKRLPKLEPEGQSYKKYTDKGSRRSSANQQMDSCFRRGPSFALSGPKLFDCSRRRGQREVTVQGLRCRRQHVHTVLAPSSGRTKATRTSHASQPPTLPWQTSAASTVRPPHGQFEHAGILFVPDTPAAILSLRHARWFLEGGLLSTKGTRPLGASGAQGTWTHIQARHRFDSELALELPHSSERPWARSQNTSQIPPTLNLLV